MNLVIEHYILITTGILALIGGLLAALFSLRKQFLDLPKRERYLVVGVEKGVKWDPPDYVVQTTKRSVAMRTCTQKPVAVYGVDLKYAHRYDFVIVDPYPMHPANNLIHSSDEARIAGLWHDKYVRLF